MKVLAIWFWDTTCWEDFPFHPSIPRARGMNESAFLRLLGGNTLLHARAVTPGILSTALVELVDPDAEWDWEWDWICALNKETEKWGTVANVRYYEEDNYRFAYDSGIPLSGPALAPRLTLEILRAEAGSLPCEK
jgi:hypothetical protein